MNKLKSFVLSMVSCMAFALYFTSCDDTKSYAELLTDETKSVNRYLADQRVENEIPADSIFETGEDAPYYRMDEDGNVYMQVVKAGNRQNMAKENQVIYFRFMRYNLIDYQTGVTLTGEGNANDMQYSPTSFRFGNYTLQSSSQWGAGIQLPLYYLGIDSEVNIVIKSQYGFTDEISSVVPYLYNIRYFKSQL